MHVTNIGSLFHSMDDVESPPIDKIYSKIPHHFKEKHNVPLFPHIAGTDIQFYEHHQITYIHSVYILITEHMENHRKPQIIPLQSELPIQRSMFLSSDMDE